jgi:hypothetical protein
MTYSAAAGKNEYSTGGSKKQYPGRGIFEKISIFFRGGQLPPKLYNGRPIVYHYIYILKRRYASWPKRLWRRSSA